MTALNEFAKYLDTKMVQPLRQVLVGRKLVTTTAPAGFGVASVEWATITEMSDGMVSYTFGDGNEDTLGFTLTTKKIPVYWKDYRIDRRAYESFRAKNLNIDTDAATSAAFVAGKVEDAAIIDGVTRDGTNYDIPGLYQGAGNNYSTVKDFGTYGNAVDAVAGAMALLSADNVPVDVPMNLVLNPTQYHELLASMSTAGVREIEQVRDLLNGGNIYSTPAINAGKGLLLPAPPALDPYVDFFLAVDWRNELGTDSEHPDTGDIIGRVYSAGILRIKQSNAICKLSSI